MEFEGNTAITVTNCHPEEASVTVVGYISAREDVRNLVAHRTFGKRISHYSIAK
jgi:hypothetical protein